MWYYDDLYTFKVLARVPIESYGSSRIDWMALSKLYVVLGDLGCPYFGFFSVEPVSSDFI